MSGCQKKKSTKNPKNRTNPPTSSSKEQLASKKSSVGEKGVNLAIFWHKFTRY